MIKRVMTAVILTAAVAATAGCQSTKQALGMSKVVPDEFRAVTMAPLVVPPDYALRPPAPGEPRPPGLPPRHSGGSGADAAGTASAACHSAARW